MVPQSDSDRQPRPIEAQPRTLLRRRIPIAARVNRRAIGVTLALVVATAAGYAGDLAGPHGAAGSAPYHHFAAGGAIHPALRSGRSARQAHHPGGKRTPTAPPSHRPPQRSTNPANPANRTNKPNQSVVPPPAAGGGKGRAALDFALAQIGKPYVYGATGPDSYDCSGLAQRAWRAAGIRIPRTTQQQASFGAAVPLDRIQPGDLVIFYADASHVGVYAGDGKVVVAPHTGASVTIQPMKWMPVYAVRRPV